MRVLHRRFTYPITVIVVLCGSSFAQNWVEIKSKNFVVTTDAGDKRGREVALRFEQMREIFGTLMLRDKINPTSPLSIIAFKDHKEISQVAPLWKGKPVELAGVYYGGEDRHFIALDLSSSAGWSVVFHEYAHMLLNTNYPPAQVWFDEGFAEYFSTIDISKKDVKVGLPPEYVAQELARGLMPVEKLFSITQSSKEYNEGDRRSQFYGEAWLVVHYLYDMKRIKQLPEYFNLTLNQKKPVAEAIKQAWGIEPKQMDREIYDYLNSRKGVYLILKLPNVGEDVTYAMRRMKDYEADGIIADLHLHSRDYFDKAGGEFEAILKKDPENADANRGLGYWYMHNNDLDKAEEYFQRAAKLGSTDARVHYLVAQALFRKGDRDPQTMYDMIQALQLAIKYDRNFAEAYNLQGFVYSNMRDFPNAIEAIKTAIRINPRNEHFQLNLAQEYMAADKYDDAIALFEKLKNSSDESIAESATRQVATARELKDKPLLRLSTREQPKDDSKEVASSADSEELKAMEARQHGEDIAKPDTRPMKYVTGKLVAVDCAQQPRAILRVLQGQKTYKLTAPSVSKMLVIGANEFSCLWKDRKVSVNYRESAPLQGDVISVEVY
jgi:tetratricopeptide (TPR) repeat protein